MWDQIRPLIEHIARIDGVERLVLLGDDGENKEMREPVAGHDFELQLTGKAVHPELKGLPNIHVKVEQVRNGETPWIYLGMRALGGGEEALESLNEEMIKIVGPNDFVRESMVVDLLLNHDFPLGQFRELLLAASCLPTSDGWKHMVGGIRIAGVRRFGSRQTPTAQVPGSFQQRGVADFHNIPLEVVCGKLASQADTPIVLNDQAFRDAGVELTRPVGIFAQSTTLDTILRRVVADVSDRLAVRYEDDIAFVSYADERDRASRGEPFSDGTTASEKARTSWQKRWVYQFAATPLDHMLAFVSDLCGERIHVQSPLLQQQTEDKTPR